MKTTITLKRALKDDDKIAPQAKAIVDVLKGKFGIGKAVDRQEVVNALTASGKLTTRQEPARILSFYQPRMKEIGLISIDKVAEPNDGKTTDKKNGGAAGAKAPAKGAGTKTSKTQAAA